MVPTVAESPAMLPLWSNTKLHLHCNKEQISVWTENSVKGWTYISE